MTKQCFYMHFFPVFLENWQQSISVWKWLIKLVKIICMCQKSKVKKFVKMVWQDASNENDARFCKKEDMYRKLSGFDIFSVKLFDTWKFTNMAIKFCKKKICIKSSMDSIFFLWNHLTLESLQHGNVRFCKKKICIESSLERVFQ